MTVAAIAVLVVVGGVVTLWLFSAYNALVGLNRLVARSWQEVDDELRRRDGLVPDLLAAVRDHGRLDPSAVRPVLRAREATREARAPGTPVAHRAAAERALSEALEDLFALAGDRLGLGTDEGYLALRRELTDIERRATAARRLYNANAARLDARLARLPASVVARVARVRPAERAGSVGAADRTGATGATGADARPSAGA